MSRPSGAPNLAQEREFFTHLSRFERGKLAELRRTLSDDQPGDSGQWLQRYIFLSGLERGNRRMQFLVAGLYALIERPHDDETEEEAQERAAREGQSLGWLLGTLYREQGERPSTEKRFLALLDADEEALPYQLRQAVSLLKGSDVKPDWAQLLRDVSGWSVDGWGDDTRRRWANDFYRAALPPRQKAEAEDTAEPAANPEETP
ncbi:type I-E CRISPR-associated protein Cse2/CasB [Deinococcus aquaedulcis]|uniref:type I-E CRISPR-associated protein Cse2/CasB n=1 Tax=Deinococcus aquaedulcis TaxID=2840455 RepID=UPI001C830D24|nr:type I-E CRISPR-associated protein Cse2/CasB [Deinococcus aquaedulcis]